MAWVFEQSSGWLSHNGARLARGYSGAGLDKDVPQDENVPDMGPLPEGEYAIGAPVDTPLHGPYVLPLAADPANAMYGRSGFLIHGDSLVHPGQASEGCIVMPRFARQRVWESGDHELQVVASIANADAAWPNA